VSLTLALARVLRPDYLTDHVAAECVKIGHGVPMMTETDGDRLIIRLAKTWSAPQALLAVIDSTPEVRDGLTKFVRGHVFDKIKAFGSVVSTSKPRRAAQDACQTAGALPP
jgi:molecular chaperone HtpG